MAKQANKPAAKPAINTAARDAACDELVSVFKADGEVSEKFRLIGQRFGGIYPDAEAMTADKAYIVQRGIIPALLPHHQDALAVDIDSLPHGGSAEFKKLGAADQATIRAKKQAHRDAMTTIHVNFGRIMDYAFPKPKAEKAKKSKIEKAYAKAVAYRNELRGLESAPFDLVTAIAALDKHIAAFETKVPKTRHIKATKAKATKATK